MSYLCLKRNEIFKPYLDTRYQVSNYGRVIGKSGKLLRGAVDADGYRVITLCSDGKQAVTRVHRMVFIAHVEEISSDIEINHKDGIKTNNRLKNLEKATSLSNTRHAHDNKLMPVAITEDQARRAFKLILKGWSNQKISDRLGVEKYAIEHIRQGDAWVWLGEKLGIKYPLPKTNNHGEANGAACKLTNVKVKKICRLLLSTMPMKQIAANFSITKTVISHINSGKRWSKYVSSLGYDFPLRPLNRKGYKHENSNNRQQSKA